jgi:hypothetical protein
MADILTLPEARAALGWGSSQHQGDDADLTATYIPAVTQIVESACGRLLDRRESWTTDNASPIATPWPVATIKSVTLGCETTTDYTFVAPTLTITDATYTAGDEVTVVAGGLPTPKPVIAAARIILVQMWNADHQGAGSDVRPDQTEYTPVGFAIPRRAEALLQPYRLAGGFA